MLTIARPLRPMTFVARWMMMALLVFVTPRAFVAAQVSKKTNELLTELHSFSGNDDPDRVAFVLDGLANQRLTRETTATIASCLELSDKLFVGRDKFEVIRLRSYVMASLSKMPTIESVRAHAVEMLKHSQDPFSRAAASRVLGRFSKLQSATIDSLLRIARGSGVEVPINLDSYRQDGVPNKLWTTDRLEAIVALGQVGGASALSGLRGIRANTGDGNKELMAVLEKAINQARASGNSKVILESNSWIESKSKPPVVLESMKFKDSNGKQVTGGELLGSPCVLVFFYVGCNNPARCPQNVENLLQFRELAKGHSDLPDHKILLVTLEPQRDRTEVLRQYATRVGFLSAKNNILLQPNSDSLRLLENSLELPVSRCCNVVTNHGVTWYLTNSNGELVGRYEAEGSNDSFKNLLSAICDADGAE